MRRNKAMYKDFWRFVLERQLIYRKRFLEKQKPPWTKDPTLRDFFFTNVYRELDRGSLYLTEFVLKQTYMGKELRDRDKLFNIFIYRLFNHIPTYEYLRGRGCQLGEWDIDMQTKHLREYKAKGNQVFTSAFTVTGVRFGDSPDKIYNICWLIGWIQNYLLQQAENRWVKNWHTIWNAPDMETAFKRVKSMKGFGAFLAYEIVIDINYAHQRWGENNFVNPGPGCKRGINHIFPDVSSPADYVRIIRLLRKRQRHEFSQSNFPWTDKVPKELSLRNIEHSLCEFQKYVKRRAGKKGGRARQFTPSKKPLPK